MDVEDIEFEKSEVFERFLLEWGDALCIAVEHTSSVSDLTAIRLVVTEFSVMASYYSDSTNGFREDIGVSLGEAVDFKLDMIKNQTEVNEWASYLEQTKEALKYLMNK